MKKWFLKTDFKLKILNFLKWKLIDIYRAVKYGRFFDEFGCTFYVGRQGSGKTTSMVEYLEGIRKKFPECLILTNFDYKYQTKALVGWRDLLDIRNGKKGVVFAIDEIHSEYSSADWKDFPEWLLREVSQQRKQKIKIIVSSQVFIRVVKPLREQAFDVVECRCIGKRWVFMRCFDGEEYNAIIDNPTPEKKWKLPRKWRRSYIMDDYIRSLFDTDKKIERMQGRDFIPREVR